MTEQWITRTKRPEGEQEKPSPIHGRPRFRANSDDGKLSVSRRYANERRAATRNMDELIGMCRMTVADGAVGDHEALALWNWLERTWHAAHEWPGDLLYACLSKTLKDGHIQEAHERELMLLIAQIAGGEPRPEGPSVSGAVPYDSPVPEIEILGKCFVFTGRFAELPRGELIHLIEEHGGRVDRAVSKRCHYLVVGSVGSDEWVHTTHGRKIEKAVALKRAGASLCIVSESHWQHCISTIGRL